MRLGEDENAPGEDTVGGGPPPRPTAIPHLSSYSTHTLFATQVASSCADKVFRVWDARTHKEASASLGKTVRLWDLRIEAQVWGQTAV